MDALLGFDVLLYLNAFYYPVFAVCNFAMFAVKYTTEEFSTPRIDIDAYVQLIINTSELLKLLLFRKFREKRKGLSVAMATFFTIVSIISLLYVFGVQYPVLKLEYGMDSIMFALLIGEFIYGMMCFVPCCKKTTTY